MGSNSLALMLAVSLLLNSGKKKEITYSVFSSKPLVTLSAEGTIEGRDTRPATIDQYFAKHNCPLTGTGQKMVEVADKYGIDFWLIPAIAWQESTCGKSVIPGSNNPFGYGIYENVTTKFDDIDTAIETLGKYFRKYFYSQGITEPCEIEKTYTPPSKGRWCKSVEYFRDELTSFKSPDLPVLKKQ